MEAGSRLYHKFSEVRQENKQVINIIRKESEWRLYESSISDYELSFRSLGYRVVRNYLRDRRRGNQKLYAIDIASGGRAIHELMLGGFIDGGLSVGLLDQRWDDTVIRDNMMNAHVLEGDLFSGNTWRRISVSLGVIAWKEGAKADVVVCRPGSGFERMPSGIKSLLIQNEIRLLNDHGRLVTKVDYDQSEKEIMENIEKGISGRNVNPIFDYRRREGVLMVDLVPK